MDAIVVLDAGRLVRQGVVFHDASNRVALHTGNGGFSPGEEILRFVGMRGD